ncbi:MAG: hypothetical protein H6713_34500 [Myxococcales bacterium]|nr:hypothetical protein [Myxococcales bacterium]MCB9755076.1 hypothetical protein [Myxococcales bacterium]
MPRKHAHSRTLGLLVGFVAAITSLAGCEDVFGFLEEPAEDATPAEPVKAATESKANPDPGAAKVAADAAKAASKAEGDAGAVALVRAYASCLSECHEGDASATDRETCALTCEQVADTGADELGEREPKALVKRALPEVKRSLAACVGECDGDRKLSVNDRATCKLTCSGSAEVLADTLVFAGPDAPAGEAAPESSCDVVCDARVELCAQGCAKDKRARADDRATCELLCREGKPFCVEGCNSERG